MIDGRTSRTSISAFMRVSATAAPGLAPIRRYDAHQSRKRGIVRHAGRALFEADRAAPLIEDRAGRTRRARSGRLSPRIVRVAHAAGVAADRHERFGLLRVGRREQRAERSALGHADQHRARRSRRFHHRPHVVQPLFERRQLADRHGIGQAGAALVEQDQPPERREAVRNRANDGSFQKYSRCDTQPMTKTRSMAPEPTTW